MDVEEYPTGYDAINKFSFIGFAILCLAWLTVPFTLAYFYIVFCITGKTYRELIMPVVVWAANLKCNRWIV